jgi:hypothetical protein
MLRHPTLISCDESIALGTPIDVAIEHLQRVTRPLDWKREWLLPLEQHVLYGVVSAEQVSLSYTSGAYDGEGQHIARFEGKFVTQADGPRLVGSYTPRPSARHPRSEVAFLCGWIVLCSLWIDDVVWALLFAGTGLAMLVHMFVDAPRYSEKLNGDVPLLRDRLRRELSPA